MDLGALTAEAFTQRLHERFRVRLGDAQAVDLELVEVTELPLVNAGVPRAPFSVVFRGPPGVALPQRIYRLEHARMGALDLFLVPIAPDREGSRFEAVFG